MHQLKSHENLRMMAPDVPVKIIDNLYLGNFNAANYNVLKKYGITSVVCLTIHSNVYEGDINLLHINDISETLAEESFTLDKLLKAIKFIDQELKSGHKVLVHCKAGASRSPTAILGYLMYSQNMSAQEAYDFLIKKAQHINPTFMGLLDELYNYLKIPGLL